MNLKGKHIGRVTSEHLGVYAISLVDKPANQAAFKNPCKSGLCTLTENNEIVGLILRPGQEITRLNEDGTEWTLLFDQPSIKGAHESFAKNLALRNSNLEHSDKYQKGVTFIESWIVENENNDKSKDYGFKPIKGEWYVKAKIENAEVLTALKADEVKGFSLEGDFDLEPIKETTKLNTNNMSLLKIWGVNKEDAEKVKMAEELEEKLDAIDDLKTAMAALTEAVNALIPAEPTEEEMATEKAATEKAAEEDKKDEEEMAAVKEELKAVTESNAKLAAQVAQIPVDFETARKKLVLSDEDKAKMEAEKLEKMSITDMIKFNKRKLAQLD